ncbi:MAG: tRNA pseudouridine(55) synthase TruB [Spirochaetaceae bacterium]|nr:tRNA pseudouridine(55) synthase TruB [Spirochaetaceae bacterium]
MKRFSGLAAIRKPAGLTSFQALGPIKRKLGSGKVGHAGTLDRFATGLLVVMAGGYSRLAPYFTALDKRYLALVRFGAETATLDPEGAVVAEAPPPSLVALEAALPAFRGPILQRPPAYSALHIDGKRAYERVLAGEEPEMKPRPVVIHELELLSYDGRDALIAVRCSSGTYIRSLARDLALAVGSRASLAELERGAIGPILLEGAVLPADFSPEGDLRFLDPAMAAALGLRPRRLEDRFLRAFRNGGAIESASLAAIEDLAAAESGPESAVFSESGEFLGLVRERPRCLEYRFVLGGES